MSFVESFLSGVYSNFSTIHSTATTPQMNRLDNLRTAYYVLEDEVQLALRTQLGDAEQLSLIRRKVLRLAERFEQVMFLHNR
jgi:hypothetical protein